MECEVSGGNKAAERQIQKKVLQLLQQVGPTNYNILMLQFGLHNGVLQNAVNELRDAKHIELDNREMVHLTDTGYRLLNDMKHWSTSDSQR